MLVSQTGADVNLNTTSKDSPLHLASFCCATQSVSNDFGVITSLLEAGILQLELLTVCAHLHSSDNRKVFYSQCSLNSHDILVLLHAL